MHYKYVPKFLDHINGIRDNNRIENLREASDQTNSYNKPRYKINKSGYKGVSWHKASSSWTLTVTRRAAWIAEYYPTTSVEPDGDALRVTFPVASPDWAAALVLRLGDAVLDVSDDAVSALARERAAAALALYPEEPAVGFPA